MLAALHYLTGDLPAARSAIETAIDQGDTHSSTVHLQRLIGSRRTAHPADGQQAPRPQSRHRPRYEPPPIPPAERQPSVPAQQPPLPRSRTDA